ncbi:MAG: hypothetical protein P9X24_07840 [Candidatus Hatepunaea meridiana]|nr:hypothetical protein [Candidatus Hatepunaea meridiana]
MKIALDVFGGDNAPEATVEGAMLAAGEASQNGYSELEIILLGNKKALEETLPETLPANVSVYDIPVKSRPSDDDPHVNGDDPDSPIRTALRLHSKGRFDAVVSAGSTGAQLIASLIELEKIPGINRPAVGSFLPTANGKCFLIDIGASLVASPHHLVQFATMGHVYVRELLGINEPRIAVLNVGHERAVGELNSIEAYRLLSESGFNFTGFVEGNDLLYGAADVVVTNGFVGNVLLKYTEGIPALLKRILPTDGSPDCLESIEKQLDYQLFGGEPLLGVKGVSIICHGASTPRAIASGIMQAAKMVRLKIHQKLETFLVTKFDSYFSQVKYLRSFRRSFRLPDRFSFRDKDDSGK